MGWNTSILIGTYAQAECRKRGTNGHGTLRKKQAHGVGRRDERQRMVGGGVVKVQVDDIPLWERRWGSGVTERGIV